MNWVLMLVLLVLVCCAIYGYTKGFLRIVFSLVAWVIVLVFVSWAACQPVDTGEYNHLRKNRSCV